MIRSDFKQPARVIEDKEGWEQLRRAKLGPCRCCGNSFLPHLHHLLSRSQGGDDVPSCLIPLCRSCHQQFHDGDVLVAQVIGASLTPAEVSYVLGKKGADFLKRRYHVEVAA